MVESELAVLRSWKKLLRNVGYSDVIEGNCLTSGKFLCSFFTVTTNL